MTPEAQQRQESAIVARHLLQLDADDSLEDPMQWTWSRISCLPSWCLLNEEERTQLQCVTGAVACAPAMLRWIDIKAIRAAHDCCTEYVIETLIGDAKQLESNPDSLFEGLPESLALTPKPEELKEHFMSIGAGVLKSSLDPSLPVERLSDSLGITTEGFDMAVAKAMIGRAQQLILVNNESEEAQ